MAYPGILIAIAAIIGIGFAYYSYSQDNHYEESHQNNHDRGSSRQRNSVPRRNTTHYPPANDGVNECCICFENNYVNFVTTRCGHTYHHLCLTMWQRNSKTCPLCREEIQVM